MKRTHKTPRPLSRREALKINCKAFGLLYRRWPQMFLSRLVRVAWGALTPYIGIYLSARLIDEIAGGRNPDRLRTLVLWTLGATAVTTLISALLARWRDTRGVGLYYKTEQLFTEKLLGMDFMRIDDPNTHKLLSTIRQNRNGGGWGLNRVFGSFESTLSALCSLSGGVALTVSLFVRRVPESAGRATVLNHPALVLPIIALMLGVTWLAPALGNKANSYYARESGNHNLGNRLFGFFGFHGYNAQNAADARIYRQERICDRFNRDKTGTFSSGGIFARYARGGMGLYAAASSAVSVVFTAFAYLFVGLKAWAGAFGVGAVTQYVQSISNVSGSVSALVRTAGDMRNNAPFLQLVLTFLELPDDMQKGDRPLPQPPYEIAFRNVSFRYPGSETYALKNVSVTFRAGDRFAVVGQNGSGKTTFIKLLCRLYDPTEGEILLNGVDIRTLRYEDYLALFSVVFQDFRLLALPLGQNVAARAVYDATLAGACLTQAGFSDRLERLPDGLDTFLYKDLDKEGVEVSGGEAQKIAIARTLYKSSASFAPFLILDEPTAALDPIAESEIYEQFDGMVGDRSALYISHRLSSCRFCRTVLVFKEGRLVQTGAHDALLADENGTYASLWHAQEQFYR